MSVFKAIFRHTVGFLLNIWDAQQNSRLVDALLKSANQNASSANYWRTQSTNALKTIKDQSDELVELRRRLHRGGLRDDKGRFVKPEGQANV